MKISKNILKTIFKKIKKNKLLISSLVVIILGSSIVYVRLKSCSDCVYSKDDINITENEYEDLLKTRQVFYKYNNQNINEESLKSELINELVNQKKVEAYAANNNIKVTESEIDALYDERIKQNSNEEQLLQKINDMYGYSKADYKKILEKDIMIEKVQSALGVPLSDWLSK